MRWLKKERIEDKKIEILSRISPCMATKVLYQRIFHQKINLDKPKYFCEKLHYLKLNDYYNNPLVTTCIDKYAVKRYMDLMGRGELCARLYGVYDEPEKIEWDKLPKQFVIKCTHGCGYNIICRDKAKLQKEKAVRQLKRWMKEDYWAKNAETQYRFINKKVIVEEYLGENLPTYRFCCFNGEPGLIYLMEENKEKTYVDYYTTDWQKLDYKWAGTEWDPHPAAKPQQLEEMLDTARILSRGFPFVRIDLYSVNGKVYLSEFTFLPAAGIMKFEDKRIARKLGSWIKL